MNLRSSLLTLLCLLGFAAISVAQPPTDEQIRQIPRPDKFDIANELMDQKQYYQALRIWLIALEETPDNANYHYKTGICYLNQNLGKTKALPHLEKCLGKISKNYDPFDFMEEDAPVDAYFYLGKAYHLNYQFTKAIEMFNKFKTEAPKKHMLMDKVEQQIAMCNNAIREIENPRQKDSKIYNMGTAINTEYSEYSPVVSLGEDILFFTSRRLRADSSNADAIIVDDGKYYEDIYVSYKNQETGEWGPAQLVSFSEVDENEATISVSPDGLKLFVYHDDKGDGNIYYSDYEDTAYSSISNIGSHINTTSWETHITFTADGNTCYFVSDRPGGLGGRDIYRSTKLPNGRWSLPYNLGAPINTPYDEDAPFISAGGTTLYFSSNSTKSMGGFDIFVSVKDEAGNFKEPEPIGYPINSVDDDVFFITSPDQKKGYFSTAREDAVGEKDIYIVEFNLPSFEAFALLKGVIKVPPGQRLPDNIIIYVTDLTEGSEPREFRPHPVTGSYVFDLAPCHEYLVDYQMNDVSFHQYQFQVPCESSYQEIEKVLNLDPINMFVAVDSLEVPVDTATVVEEKDELKWVVRGKLPGTNVVAEYLDEAGNVLYSENVNEKGEFKYKKLPDNKVYIFRLKANDETLCDQLVIELVDNNKKIVGKTVRDDKCKFKYQKDEPVNVIEPITAEPVNYERYYKYNKKGISAEEKEYKKFIDGIIKLIKANGVVYIELEASASKVPTTTYNNNDNLAKLRLEEAKQRLLATLKARGVDTSKVKFVTEISLVQGPEYNDDFIENRPTYEKYQYIRMRAK